MTACSIPPDENFREVKLESARRSIWLPMLGYVVMVSVLALTHDVWRDEVRAFSVATRAPSWASMLFDLHEEGHPAVWYAILRAGYAVTHSPFVLPVAAALIGIVTTYLILRFAPYPLWARLLTVFGAFLGYELTVVARNYGIGVLLLVAACALFARRDERAWMLSVALALLANTSIHAAAASALILLVWCLDLFDVDRRIAFLRPGSIAAVVLVIGAIALALATASPPAAMAFAFSLSKFDPAVIARAVIVDPGYGLKGAGGADVVSSGAIPWSRLGLDAAIMSRVLVNVAMLNVAWSLRRHARILMAFVLAILGFELIFQLVYPAGPRHEAMLAFLIIALGWIAINSTPETDRAAALRRITLGLLPLLAIQAAALPFLAWRGIQKPESMGAELANVIRATPRYAAAVLMSEPDPLMETLPFYVSNPVFMPRQGEMDYRAYFDDGTMRQRVLPLSRLTSIADSVACASGRPVLLSIGHRRFLLDSAGVAAAPYESTFTWTAAEKAAFEARAAPLPWFAGATSDENFRTYEIAPASQCMVH